MVAQWVRAIARYARDLGSNPSRGGIFLHSLSLHVAILNGTSEAWGALEGLFGAGDV